MRCFRQKHLVLVALLPASVGCINPGLTNSIFGEFYPVAPGDEPFVAVRVVNDTAATLDVPIVYDVYGDGTVVNTYLITNLNPEGRETGVVLGWPVSRIAIGDLDNPVLPTIAASFPSQDAIVAPFNHPALEAGTDFDSGDTILFYINEDSRSPVFLVVSIGLIDGATQRGPFSRADPFESATLLLNAFENNTLSQIFGGRP